MQNSFQPEETKTPRNANLAAPRTSFATGTEADAQAARLATERLNDITKRARRAKRRLWALYIAGYACSTLIALRIVLTMNLNNPLVSPLACFALAFGPLMLAPMFWLVSRATPKFDAEEIARLGGVQAIVPLFATLRYPLPSALQRPLFEALTLLLPQMKASDASLLTPAIRQIIYVWLRTVSPVQSVHSYPDDLRIAALKALEQVGASSDISVVERLAATLPITPGGTYVRQAAIDCLPMLRAHCGDVEAAQTLLRASQSETTAPATLLRPVSGAGQTNLAELLRGTDSPHSRE